MKRKIGLITPYTGFNLGDGAIQDAMLHNLKSLDPAVECYGITLYPADTENRHGIQSIPLTGLIVPNYSEPELIFTRELLSTTGGNVDNQADETIDNGEEPPLSPWRKIVEILRGVKSLPFLGSVSRFIVFRLRDIKKLAVEGREFLRAFRFARNLDLLVLSGGGQLDESCGGPWGHPYAIFRWSLIGRLTGTPFAVASNGSAMIESSLTRWFLKNALRSAIYRSYRDQGTKDQLSLWKFTQNDPIVRDLALSLDPAHYLPSEPRDDSQLIIAISPIYHSSPQYTEYKTFVEGMIDFIQWLVERGDRVLLFRSTSIERFVIKDIWIGLRERFKDNIPDQVKEVEASRYQDLLMKIADADLVVGSRLHSIILSHVLRKPTLAITWDRKVSAHMEALNQIQYMIDIQSVNGDTLKSAFKNLERDADNIRAGLSQYIDNFQTDLKKQYEMLLQLASS